jgi:hypothetical protein
MIGRQRDQRQAHQRRSHTGRPGSAPPATARRAEISHLPRGRPLDRSTGRHRHYDPQGNSASTTLEGNAGKRRVRSLTELAKAEKITLSYICRVLRLTLLAPDLVEAILNGQDFGSLQLSDLLQPLSVFWAEQRRTLSTRAAVH